MSRFFTIEGKFKQDGVWVPPDPSFRGKVIVEEDGSLSGYCDELYDSISKDKTRYLFGFMSFRGAAAKGIAFFKLSNSPGQAPLFYSVPIFGEKWMAQWGALSVAWGKIDGFFSLGEASIRVEEELYSEEARNDIEGRLGSFDQNINYNGLCQDEAAKKCCENLASLEEFM